MYIDITFGGHHLASSSLVSLAAKDSHFNNPNDNFRYIIIHHRGLLRCGTPIAGWFKKENSKMDDLRPNVRQLHFSNPIVFLVTCLIKTNKLGHHLEIFTLNPKKYWVTWLF